jgi:pyruvate/2-oxoglutarate dehydrogenase complex dihydrolipoamide dehydrogenase (E3) component
MIDLIVLGAGPAGELAALRAAELGARTRLVTSAAFGGMAANDGPVPVRTLAHAALLIRDARQLGQYGVAVSKPVLDYPRLLARVREVVNDVRAHSSLRQQIDSLGVTVHEHAGARRRPGSRGGQRGTPTQPHRELASTPGSLRERQKTGTATLRRVITGHA